MIKGEKETPALSVFSVYLANYLHFLLTQLTSNNITLVKNLILKYIKI